LRSKARALLHFSTRAGIQLVAPTFFPSECDSAVLKRVVLGDLSVEEAEQAFRVFDRVDIELLAPPGLRARARQLALQFGLGSVYDAVYAALAEIQGCEFWSADRPFVTLLKPRLPFVRYLADFSL
jgi:predicted nucleic acid-binding protein